MARLRRVLGGYEASETLVGFRAAINAERVSKAASAFFPSDGEFVLGSGQVDTLALLISRPRKTGSVAAYRRA